MARLGLLLVLLALALPAAAAETVDETLGTGEVMAFGVNTYLVYLELSELTADDPSWVLAATGLLAGGLTLALKDYDGTLFGDFFTGIAAVDLLLGAWLLRAPRMKVAPIVAPRPRDAGLSLGISLAF